VLAPRLAARTGAASAVGLLLAAAAMAWLSRLDADSSYWPLLVGLIPLGAGMGLAMTPATSAITTSLARAQQGVGSAMNDLARELGGALGIAVLGSVMQSVYRAHLALHGVPAGVAGQARASAALALHLGPSVADSARVAFLDGFRSALLVAAGVMLVVALGVLCRRAAGAAQAHRSS
ncbi:MAG: MFS transporter, partial [Nocardioides sp.]